MQGIGLGLVFPELEKKLRKTDCFNRPWKMRRIMERRGESLTLARQALAGVAGGDGHGAEGAERLRSLRKITRGQEEENERERERGRGFCTGQQERNVWLRPCGTCEAEGAGYVRERRQNVSLFFLR
jgi:hypothetical protein